MIRKNVSSKPQQHAIYNGVKFRKMSFYRTAIFRNSQFRKNKRAKNAITLILKLVYEKIDNSTPIAVNPLNSQNI